MPTTTLFGKNRITQWPTNERNVPGTFDSSGLRLNLSRVWFSCWAQSPAKFHYFPLLNNNGSAPNDETFPKASLHTTDTVFCVSHNFRNHNFQSVYLRPFVGQSFKKPRSADNLSSLQQHLSPCLVHDFGVTIP